MAVPRSRSVLVAQAATLPIDMINAAPVPNPGIPVKAFINQSLNKLNGQGISLAASMSLYETLKHLTFRYIKAMRVMERLKLLQKIR